MRATPSFENIMPNADGVYPNQSVQPVQLAANRRLYRNEELINRGIGSLSATWHILSGSSNALNLVAATGADYFQEQNNVYSPPSLFYEIFYGNPGTSVLGMTRTTSRPTSTSIWSTWSLRRAARSRRRRRSESKQNTPYLNTDYTFAKNLTGNLQNINTGTIVQVDEDSATRQRSGHLRCRRSS